MTTALLHRDPAQVPAQALAAGALDNHLGHFHTIVWGSLGLARSSLAGCYNLNLVTTQAVAPAAKNHYSRVRLDIDDQGRYCHSRDRVASHRYLYGRFIVSHGGDQICNLLLDLVWDVQMPIHVNRFCSLLKCTIGSLLGPIV